MTTNRGRGVTLFTFQDLTAHFHPQLRRSGHQLAQGAVDRQLDEAKQGGPEFDDGPDDAVVADVDCRQPPQRRGQKNRDLRWTDY